MAGVPPCSIVLFEDVDAAFVDKEIKVDSDKEEDDNSKKRRGKLPGQLTYAGLLNARLFN